MGGRLGFVNFRQRLMEEGHIQVNGKPAKPTHAPRAGDEIRIHQPPARPVAAQPEKIPLEILFEDKITRRAWEKAQKQKR